MEKNVDLPLESTKNLSPQIHVSFDCFRICLAGAAFASRVPLAAKKIDHEDDDADDDDDDDDDNENDVLGFQKQ